MNKVYIAVLLIGVSTGVSAGEYGKPNGLLTLVPGNHGGVEFSINAANDASGVCNMEGNAELVPPSKTQLHRWVFDDKNSQCVAVLSENRDGTLNVTTKACDGYCGVSAIGAMDGLFAPK